MDREYTLQFFFTHKSLEGNEAEKFKAMFLAFDDIAGRCKAKITKRLGKGMHTSRSKVLDNAVVGWVLNNGK